MKSPFPGMDPYLERHWGDVHTRLMVYASDQMHRQLPRSMRVRVEEHVTIESEGERIGSAYPGIRIIERPESSPGRSTAQAGAAVADIEPMQVPIDEPATGRSILIYDTSSRDRLVTVIEILSPANKNSDEGRELYARKQDAVRAAGVNLVEIDLLRGSHYVLVAPQGRFPEERPDACYFACVTRAIRPRWTEVYPITLRETLPTIRIPLRSSDPEARLDLQSLIDQAYESVGYGDDIDYRQNPIPPLREEDAAWADALLREKGRR